MVNVTHNTYNRGAFHHLAFVLFLLFQQFLDHVNFFFLFTDNIVFNSDIFCFLKADLRVQSHNLTGQEQLLDDHGRLHFHLIRKIL